MDVKAFHVTISLMLTAVAALGCAAVGVFYLLRSWREKDKRARFIGLLWFIVPTVVLTVWTWPHLAYLWTEHQWRAHFLAPGGADAANYDAVFRRMLTMRWEVFARYFGIGAGFLLLNILIARFVCRLRGGIDHWAVTQSSLMHRLLTIACAGAAGAFAFVLMWQWEAYWNAEAYDEGVGRVPAIVQYLDPLFGTPDHPAAAAPWTDVPEIQDFSARMEAALQERFADDPNVQFLTGAESGGGAHKQAPEPPHYFLRTFLELNRDGTDIEGGVYLQLTGGGVLERDRTVLLGRDGSYKKWLAFKETAADGQQDAAAIRLAEQAAESRYLKDGFCDPIFYKNVGYYLFKFPKTRYESLWVKALLLAALLLIAYQYRYYYHRDTHSMPRALRGIAVHGSFLWIALLGASAWRADISRQSILYLDTLFGLRNKITQSSVNYFHILQSEASTVYIYALAAIGFALLVNMFWKNRKVWWGAAVVWAAAYALILWAYPALYNHFWIKPNPGYYNPYMEKHIAMTRRGFKLDAVEKNESISGQATLQDVRAHPEALRNVQLWNRVYAWKHVRIKETFTKPFYSFHKYMDVDRYVVDGELRQVLLGVREIDPGERKKKAWSSMRMIYTHGYGVVAAPVNESDAGGAPRMWVSGADLKKPKVNGPFAVKRPEIYYGEMNNSYAFVHSVGDAEQAPPDVYGAPYKGDGGVAIGSGLERWAWATRLLNPYRVAMTRDLNAESRVMLHRHVVNRARILAPFLKFDPDPYIVIGEDSGKLWWVIDVYTATGRYPYSERRRALDIYGNKIHDLGGETFQEPDFRGFNYIRNSAVAVADPYNGSVHFYVTEPHDPLIRMYQRHFGELFRSLEEMPSEIRKHLRYPDYLMWVQASMYGRYHVDNVKVFRSNGDAWGIPNEKIYDPRGGKDGRGANTFMPMMPHYTVLTLPDSDRPEFISVLPMSPIAEKSRTQLRAWLVARSDGENYGQLTCYMLPIEDSIIGPKGVEDKIESNEAVKTALGLLDQNDSRVARGSLLLLPVPTRSGETALIYVEPIYVEAAPGAEEKDSSDEPRLPTLNSVVIVAGERLDFDARFDKALEKTLMAGLRGGISGAVRDEAGAPISGAYIDIINAETGDSVLAKTNASGRFESADLLPEMDYWIDFYKPGRERMRISARTLAGSITLLNDITLGPEKKRTGRTLAEVAQSAYQAFLLYDNGEGSIASLEEYVRAVAEYARDFTSNANNRKPNRARNLREKAMSASQSMAQYKRLKKDRQLLEAGEAYAQLETDLKAIVKLADLNGAP